MNTWGFCGSVCGRPFVASLHCGILLIWATVVVSLSIVPEDTTEDTTVPPTCENSSIVPGIHWPADTESLRNLQTSTAAACAKACCNELKCSHWVWTSEEPGSIGSCGDGGVCCWLKSGATGHLQPQPRSNCTVGVLPGRWHIWTPQPSGLKLLDDVSNRRNVLPLGIMLLLRTLAVRDWS